MKWALQRESFLVRVLDSREPALQAYREAVARLRRGEGGDYQDQLHDLFGAFAACKAVLENAPAEEIESRRAAGQSAFRRALALPVGRPGVPDAAEVPELAAAAADRRAPRAANEPPPRVAQDGPRQHRSGALHRRAAPPMLPFGAITP